MNCCDEDEEKTENNKKKIHSDYMCGWAQEDGGNVFVIPCFTRLA